MDIPSCRRRLAKAALQKTHYNPSEWTWTKWSCKLKTHQLQFWMVWRKTKTQTPLRVRVFWNWQRPHIIFEKNGLSPYSLWFGFNVQSDSAYTFRLTFPSNFEFIFNFDSNFNSDIPCNFHRFTSGFCNSGCNVVMCSLQPPLNSLFIAIVVQLVGETCDVHLSQPHCCLSGPSARKMALKRRRQRTASSTNVRQHYASEPAGD